MWQLLLAMAWEHFVLSLKIMTLISHGAIDYVKEARQWCDLWFLPPAGLLSTWMKSHKLPCEFNV